MIQQTIRTGNARITIKTGTEGPRHDPYGYTELTVERNGFTATHHEGLGTWIELDSARINGKSEADMSDTFARYIGYSLKDLHRALHMLEGRGCPDHRWRYAQDVEGYPGESFTICKECDRTISSSFDISAVI